MSKGPFKPSDSPATIESPPWSNVTKTIVAVVALLLLALIVQRFQFVIGQVVAAAILAYLLSPLVKVLEQHTRIRRGVAIAMIYVGVAVIVLWALIAFGMGAYRQVLNLIDAVPSLVSDIFERLSATTAIVLGPFTLNLEGIAWDDIVWKTLREQLLGSIRPLVSQGSRTIIGVVNSMVQLISTVIFVFIISIYVVVEIPKLGDYVGRVAERPGYRRDAERLMREFGRIWRAYLRGQVILALVIGGVVWFSMALLGVQDSFALGVLAGLLEFLPIIGPIIATAIAVIVGFFQPGNYLGLAPGYFALAILVVMLLIQQLENSVLVPRIVGGALDLHPLIVIIGVLMGSTLAGLIGIILAAPVLATIKLFGVYTWRKMFDLPPFPISEAEDQPPGPSLLERARLLRARIRR